MEYRVRVATRWKWLTGYDTLERFPTLEMAIAYGKSLEEDDVLVDTPAPDDDSYDTTWWDKRRYHVLIRGRWRRLNTVKFRKRKDALNYAYSLSNRDVSVVDYNNDYTCLWMKGRELRGIGGRFFWHN